jgi:hypothetical protein
MRKGFIPAPHVKRERQPNAGSAGNPGLDGQQVIKDSRTPVLDVRLYDRKEKTGLLYASVAHPQLTAELISSRLRKPQVIGVIHDPHGIHVAINDPVSPVCLHD